MVPPDAHAARMSLNPGEKAVEMPEMLQMFELKMPPDAATSLICRADHARRLFRHYNMMNDWFISPP